MGVGSLAEDELGREDGTQGGMTAEARDDRLTCSDPMILAKPTQALDPAQQVQEADVYAPWVRGTNGKSHTSRLNGQQTDHSSMKTEARSLLL